MTEAVIGLGSNLGDGQRNLCRAWHMLGDVRNIRLLRLSSPYFSEPVGIKTSNWFTNAVGLIGTALSPDAVLTILLKIERDMGRRRTQMASLPIDRIIDLDLIYYGDVISSSEALTVPHAEIQNRLFVLAPLAELIPDHRHPVLGLTSSQMLAHLVSCKRTGPSPSKVRKMKWQEKTVRTITTTDV